MHRHPLARLAWCLLGAAVLELGRLDYLSSDGRIRSIGPAIGPGWAGVWKLSPVAFCDLA